MDVLVAFDKLPDVSGDNLSSRSIDS